MSVKDAVTNSWFSQLIAGDDDQSDVGDWNAGPHS